ncbi:11090_t:CDS:2, partial [Funneliformis geosporum]
RNIPTAKLMSTKRKLFYPGLRLLSFNDVPEKFSVLMNGQEKFADYLSTRDSKIILFSCP